MVVLKVIGSETLSRQQIGRSEFRAMNEVSIIFGVIAQH
jgi:hypothetical protein